MNDPSVGSQIHTIMVVNFKYLHSGGPWTPTQLKSHQISVMFEKLITIGNFVNKPIWGYPLNNLKHCRMNDYFPTRREKSFACQSPPPYITISPSHLADNNYIQVIQ